MTSPARHHAVVRRAGDRHRQGHRCLLPRHRHEEFLRFLKKVARAYPRVELHIVADNAPRTSTPTRRPGSPGTSGSCCTTTDIRVLAEHDRDLFGIITRQAVRRGTFTSSRASSPRSRNTSTAGTNAASPSAGLRPRRWWTSQESPTEGGSAGVRQAGTRGSRGILHPRRPR